MRLQRVPRSLTLLVLVLVVVATSEWFAAGASLPDPFEFFHPELSLVPADRLKLDAGQAIVKSLESGDGEVAVFSAMRVSIDGDRLVAWVRRIQDLKQSKFAPAVRRFSHPPVLEDLAALELDEVDLDDLRRCRQGSCGLKLREDEIATLSRVARERRPDWRKGVQEAFREVMLDRAQAYLNDGMSRATAGRDGDVKGATHAESAPLLAHSRFLSIRLPELTEFLMHYPHVQRDDIESFLYWSKENLSGKPIVSINHVTIARDGDGRRPDAAVVSRQVFATHYITASLAVTVILGAGDAPRYLAYLNRSKVDVLNGFFGGIVRRVMERRLREESVQVIDQLRRRLEAGNPPSAAADVPAPPAPARE